VASAFRRKAALLIPGSLDTKTGGYVYDRRIVEGLRQRGWSVQVTDTLRDVPDGTPVLADGLAFGVMPGEAERHARRLPIVALVHHPLAEETGLSADEAARLRDSERRALRTAAAVVVTSQATARMLPAYGVPVERVTVIVPGTDPAPLARGSGERTAHLLCVASLIPRKGHAVLLPALALQQHPWRLTCVGAERHPGTANELARLAGDLRIADRVTLAGEMEGDALQAQYDGADAFALPTLYEGYGMVVADALARGLPVVASSTGAIPDLVTSECGIVVPPGDVDALRAALEVMLDARARERFAHGARARRADLPTWDDAVGRMEAVLRSVSP
jgi:glycosyltransferase involved in cell wall biosynthesis